MALFWNEINLIVFPIFRANDGCKSEKFIQIGWSSARIYFCMPRSRNQGLVNEKVNYELEFKHFQVFGWRQFAIGQGLNRQPKLKEDWPCLCLINWNNIICLYKIKSSLDVFYNKIHNLCPTFPSPMPFIARSKIIIFLFFSFLTQINLYSIKIKMSANIPPLPTARFPIEENGASMCAKKNRGRKKGEGIELMGEWIFNWSNLWELKM